MATWTRHVSRQSALLRDFVPLQLELWPGKVPDNAVLRLGADQRDWCNDIPEGTTKVWLLDESYDEKSERSVDDMWAVMDALPTQLDDLLAKHPQITHLHGDVMQYRRGFTISHPLQHLTWYPNHEYTEILLKGDALPTTLQHVAMTGRALLRLSPELVGSAFSLLRVIDLGAVPLQTAHALLRDTPVLEYLAIAISEEDKNPATITVRAPRLKTFLHRSGRFHIDSATATSLEEFGFTGALVSDWPRGKSELSSDQVSAAGPLTALKRLHIRYSLVGFSVEGSNERWFPNVEHVRLQAFCGEVAPVDDEPDMIMAKPNTEKDTAADVLQRRCGAETLRQVQISTQTRAYTMMFAEPDEDELREQQQYWNTLRAELLELAPALATKDLACGPFQGRSWGEFYGLGFGVDKWGL